MSERRAREGQTSTYMAEGPATFGLHERDDCAVVVATGEIDLYTAPAMRACLVAAAESSSRVLIDLSGVTFLDSTGLGVMLGALGRAGQDDQSVVLVGSTNLVRRVLEITRLDQVFPMYASLEEALAAQSGSELQAL
jgi:anti-sigma B factor antagonist